MSINELRAEMKRLEEQRNKLSVESEAKIVVLNKEIENVVCEIRKIELSLSKYRL